MAEEFQTPEAKDQDLLARGRDLLKRTLTRVGDKLDYMGIESNRASDKVEDVFAKFTMDYSGYGLSDRLQNGKTRFTQLTPADYLLLLAEAVGGMGAMSYGAMKGMFDKKGYEEWRAKSDEEREKSRKFSSRTT